MKKLMISSTLLVVLFSFIVLNVASGKSPKELITPLLNREKVLGINQWLPSQVLGSQINAPLISAKAAIFLETKNGQVLYSKSQNQRLPIASLVKVMTVLIALEHKKMEDTYIVSQRAADMEPDKMLLISGERLTLKELLSGIFLVSANDAAEVLAEGTVDRREEFIHLMNSRALQLGMKDTFFANPTGLDEDADNSLLQPSAEGKVLRAQEGEIPDYARAGSYSSAYDLALLTRYLIRHYPEVVDISKTEHILLPQTETHQDYDMYSGINLLTTYPGVVGFKTGYTPEAGYTLITLVRKDGQEVIGVLLGSESRRDEARELLDYSFNKLK